MGLDGRVFDLSQPMEPAMPVSPNHPGFRMALIRRHGDMVRPDGGSAANELIVMGGHTGTHLDGLAHVSQDGHLHGGIDATAAVRGSRYADLGIETVAPIVVPGVLLDVAGFRGLEALPPGEPISADELAATASAQGVEVPEQGAVVIRSGWARHWSDATTYVGHDTGVPGVAESGAEWLAARRPRVAAHDSMAFEQIPAGAGHRVMPVHRVLLVEHGIHIIENINAEELAAARAYTFTFICLPLRMVGATGSPVRPIAIAGAP